MINGLQSYAQNAMAKAFANEMNTPKEKEERVSSVSKSVPTSRIDELKQAISDGTYRVDISSLAKKMAEELI